MGSFVAVVVAVLVMAAVFVLAVPEAARLVEVADVEVADVVSDADGFSVSVGYGLPSPKTWYYIMSVSVVFDVFTAPTATKSDP